MTAFSTGFRANELATLTPQAFDLDGPTPVVLVAGRHSKKTKSARQPLPPGVARQLREYLAGKPATRPIWPGTWAEDPASVLRRDLEVAGVPYRLDTADGARYADFHALRHSFLTALTGPGVDIKELQELARRSDPRLTLNVYTHVRPEALAASVGHLPLPAGPDDPLPSPLAGLSPAELLAAAESLTAMVAEMFDWFAPRVAPTNANSGGDGRQPGRKAA